MEADGFVSVTDNGRGIRSIRIPSSAAGRRLSDRGAARRRQVRVKVYETSGGLRGVGISVTNASPAASRSRSREQPLYRMRVSRARQARQLQEVGARANRRGTKCASALI